MRVGGQGQASTGLPPRKRPDTQRTRMGGLQGGKSRPQLGFDPWTVQPVASRYTDCATQPTSLPWGPGGVRDSKQHEFK